jgi:hypothetical protein
MRTGLIRLFVMFQSCMYNFLNIFNLSCCGFSEIIGKKVDLFLSKNFFSCSLDSLLQHLYAITRFFTLFSFQCFQNHYWSLIAANFIALYKTIKYGINVLKLLFVTNRRKYENVIALWILLLKLKPIQKCFMKTNLTKIINMDPEDLFEKM